MLQRPLDSGVQLPPVDIAIRNFIRQGIICSSIVFPPLAATSLEGASTINVGQDSLLLNSQDAAGILGSVVSGIITPAHGIGCLENIFTSSAPNIGSSFDDFVSYFDSLSSKWSGGSSCGIDVVNDDIPREWINEYTWIFLIKIEF